jgi:hypothetical protein
MYFYLLFMLVCVVAYNILNKLQNVLKSPTGNTFNHPYLQAAISCFGHLLGFPHYFILTRYFDKDEEIRETDPGSHSTFGDTLIIEEKEREERNEKKKKFPPLIVWIPSLLDLFEHITRNISMTLIAASAASMLRSTIVIFTAILSVVYLKNKLYRHHALAVFLIIIGTTIVGAALLIEGGKNN